MATFEQISADYMAGKIDYPTYLKAYDAKYGTKYASSALAGNTTTNPQGGPSGPGGSSKATVAPKTSPTPGTGGSSPPVNAQGQSDPSQPPNGEFTRIDPTNGAIMAWELQQDGSYGYSYKGITNPNATRQAVDVKIINGYEWTVDAQGNPLELMGKAGQEGTTPYQQKQLAQSEAEQIERQRQFDIQQKYQQQQDAARAAFEQQQFAWQQQQAAAQAEMQRQQYLANLKANPASWLEYAMASNQQPVVQPWMTPLMYGQQGQQVGQQFDVSSQSAMPNLLTPSAQYMARMSPSMQAQYGGYQKAKTGANPADTDFWMRSVAPPGGGAPAINYNR